MRLICVICNTNTDEETDVHNDWCSGCNWKQHFEKKCSDDCPFVHFRGFFVISNFVKSGISDRHKSSFFMDFKRIKCYIVLTKWSQQQTFARMHIYLYNIGLQFSCFDPADLAIHKNNSECDCVLFSNTTPKKQYICMLHLVWHFLFNSSFFYISRLIRRIQPKKFTVNSEI